MNIMNTRMFKWRENICDGLSKYMDVILLHHNYVVYNKRLEDSKTIFINSRLKEFLILKFIDEILPKIKHPVNIIIAGEDYTFPNNTDKRIVSDTNLCVHGGGLDVNPKLWEAILIGVIPIIRENKPYTDIYTRLDFPVVIIKEWESDTITEENLILWHNKYYNYFINNDKRKKILHNLTLDYWVEYINSHLV